MANFSFDIVSDYNKAELNNVFDQSLREIANRYDFKNTPANIEWLNNDKTGIKIIGNSDWQIDAIVDIFRKKLATRSQSQKLLDLSRQVTTNNFQTTKEVPFKRGIDQDKAKEINKRIRDEYPKAKTQIQGDRIRVMSSSKDELQAVIKLINQLDFDFPISFENYR